MLTQALSKLSHLLTNHSVAKGEIMSEDIRGFLLLPKNIPKNYLKLSYPVHGNDKILVGFDKLHVRKYYSYEKKYRIESLVLICV